MSGVTTRDALAKALCASEDVSTPTTWDHLTEWRRDRYREQADRLLASPAIDVVLAERVAALSVAGRLLERVAATKQNLRCEALPDHLANLRDDLAFDKLRPQYQAQERADAAEWLRALAAALSERTS